MVRSVKKPGKKICTLCKKYRIRVTLKRGGKRVYKKESVLKRQLKRKMKGRSKFGSSCQSGYNPMSLFGRHRRRGVKRTTRKRRTTKRRTTTRKRTTRKRTVKRTTRHRSGFGKTTQVRKLHKLCKVYGVKIGRKSPSVLRKQCLKKAKTMLKKVGRRSRFGWSPLRAAAQLTPGGQLFIDSNAKVELKKLKAQQASGREQMERDDARRRQEARDAAAAEERKAAREEAARRQEREDKKREREDEERKEEKKLRQAKQDREDEERREMKKLQLQHEMEEKAHQRELEKAAALAKLGTVPAAAAFGKRRRRGRPGRPRKVGRPRKAGRR